MSDDYQVRKDIDRLINDTYNLEDNSLKLVQFADDTNLYITINDVTRKMTIDEIISDYYNKSEIQTAIDGKADSEHTHTKSQITDFPTLATVATTGSYTDLSNKAHNHTLSDITDYTDTEWIEVEYSSGYTRYGTNRGVYYRRRGNIVELQGEWGTTATSGTYPSSGGEIATIPSSIAPSKIINIRMQGSQTNTYLLTIGTSGSINWSRYGVTGDTELPYYVWGNVHAVWTI